MMERVLPANEFLFPIADYWPFLAGFILFVVLLLVLDLTVFHRKAHSVSIREATLWVVC